MASDKYSNCPTEIKHRIEKALNSFSDKVKDNDNFKQRLIDKPDWRELYIKKKGDKWIIKHRCQAVKKRTGGKVQCNRAAQMGMLVCKEHGGKSRQRAIQVRKELHSYGLYNGTSIKALQKEIEEVEAIPQERKESVSDEINLAVAVIRKYLSKTDDETIARRPYTLIYLLESVLSMKKAQFDMTHSPKVAFTREQVEYLFMKVRMAILNCIKDQDLLEKIKLEIQKIAVDLKTEGWRL